MEPFTKVAIGLGVFVAGGAALGIYEATRTLSITP